MTEEKETQIKTHKVTEADKIWDEISKLPISIFALPNQRVEDHLEKLPVPGNVLYVRPRSPAVIQALEVAIGANYVVQTTEKGYFQVTRTEKLPEIQDDYVVFQRGSKVEKIPKKKLYGSE
jgi:hypothetical protein